MSISILSPQKTTEQQEQLLQHFKSFCQGMCAKKLLELNRPSEALACINQMIHRNPEFQFDHSLRLIRAQAYLKLELAEDALSDVYSVLEEKSDDDEALELFHKVEALTKRIYMNPFRKV